MRDLIFDDGDIVNKILRRNNHEKEYIVTVNRPVTKFVEQMRNGVPILETVTRKCKVEQISNSHLKLSHQGLNRQLTHVSFWTTKKS